MLMSRGRFQHECSCTYVGRLLVVVGGRVYTPKQIAGIREACKIGREVLDIAGTLTRQMHMHSLCLI